MSVDYKSKFGLGFKINLNSMWADESKYIITFDGKVIDDAYDLSEYIDETSDYCIDNMGDNYYGSSEEWYIFIKKPFDKGYDLTKEVEKLIEYCKNLNIEIISEFDCYGGLYTK